MKTLAANPHTREGMKQLISQVTVIQNGLVRLKAAESKYILTSLDPELRALWNQRTDSKKNTPPIEELLQFIKDQADQMEDNTASKPEERVRQLQVPRHKGSAHSVVNPVPAQQRGSQPRTNQTSPHRPTSSTTSSCPMCQGGHLVPPLKAYLSPRGSRRSWHSSCASTAIMWHMIATPPSGAESRSVGESITP